MNESQTPMELIRKLSGASSSPVDSLYVINLVCRATEDADAREHFKTLFPRIDVSWPALKEDENA